MRIKESLILSSMITERATSLANMTGNLDKLEERAKVLAELIKCKEAIDAITAKPEVESKVNNIDIDINLPPGAGNGKGTPFQPFDGGDIAAAVKKELRKAVV